MHIMLLHWRVIVGLLAVVTSQRLLKESHLKVLNIGSKLAQHAASPGSLVGVSPFGCCQISTPAARKAPNGIEI